MRLGTLLVVGAALAALSGCLDAIEQAAEAAAEFAEECGGEDSDHGGGTLLPVAIAPDSTFEIRQAANLLVFHGNASASVPGSVRVEVRDPHDAVVFRLEVGPGGTSGEGAKELLGPEPGDYEIVASGTPEARYDLQVFWAGCGAV